MARLSVSPSWTFSDGDDGLIAALNRNADNLTATTVRSL
jgi:hypothetical protein